MKAELFDVFLRCNGKYFFKNAGQIASVIAGGMILSLVAK